MPGVVVGVDRSRASEAALRWATAEATLRGLPLTLVHAWNAPVALTVELPAGTLPDTAWQATSTATPGRPAEVLLAQRADLLVLGGHADAHRATPVVAACLHRSDCPVVVVPDELRDRLGSVVVGVDGTASSHHALRWAAEEAQLRSARLVVVHAWQPGLSQVRAGRARESLGAERAMAHLRAWVGATLGHLEVDLRVRHAGPLDEMYDEAARADLLVLGRSHPHAWFGKVLHAALSDDLSGLAPCPVVVVPHGAAAG